jgi:uncharacterized protein
LRWSSPELSSGGAANTSLTNAPVASNGEKSTVLAFGSLAAAAKRGNVSAFNRTRDACLAADVAVADTFLRRLKGLLGQTHGWVQAHRGLWIVPSRGVHMFGMRFAIDVVFLGRGEIVVHLEQNLRPWRVSRVVPSARSVLELPAGAIARTATRVGDRIAFRSEEKSP